ncbi:MAG: 1-acyl-sn-glycerol-3-phosphate acyltransferase [Ruminococcaceae bacterium]|nr:1-acyl-sn-glycerol-3-phosphate acyltransferase [Oscillospiraceae bacterium]
MYEFFRWLALISAWPAQLIWFKKKIFYQDRKSQGRKVKGNALVISNHYSALDYMVNLYVFPGRKLYVVLSEMIYQLSKFFYFGMRCFGGIQSRRDIMGMGFIDEAVKVLEKGKMVQIFPEAYTNDKDKVMQPFKPSYIMIALRSGAPIIPVITDGNYGLFKRVHVIIGEKIYISDYCTSENPSREEIQKLNDMVFYKCLELQKELDTKIAGEK